MEFIFLTLDVILAYFHRQVYTRFIVALTSDVVGVKLLREGSPINGAPPPPLPITLFLPFGLGRVSCRRHNMRWPLVISCRTHNMQWQLVIVQYIWVDGSAISPAAVQWWSPEGGRICILWYPNPGLLLSNNSWMVMHFFHVHCSKKSQENPKGPKFSILKFFIRNKNVYVL